MYKRAGCLISNVTRHLTKNVHNNTRDNSSLLLLINPNKNQYVCFDQTFRRDFSDKKSEEPITENEIEINPDKYAEMNLKKYLADPENEKMFKRIELEIEILREKGDRVPQLIKPRYWWELTQLPSRGQRQRYLEFCWKVEKKKENRKEKQLEKQQQFLERPPPTTEYRLGKNTMFLRLYDSTINHWYHSRLMNEMLFGQPVVFDCGYNDAMTRREAKNCAKQLNYTFGFNRSHDNPFNMYFCNFEPTSLTMQCLYRLLPCMYDNDFPLNIEKRSYTDIFEKDRLVYLSPHAQDVMTEFDHDAVYIIGAYVDKATDEPLSYAKAKKEKIRSQKFPLDHYLDWGTSSAKNLTLNSCLGILLDLKKTGSWEKAFEIHVPSRKLRASREASEIRRLYKVFEEENVNIDDNFSIEKFQRNFRKKVNGLRKSNFDGIPSKVINRGNYENKDLKLSAYTAFKKK